VRSTDDYLPPRAAGLRLVWTPHGPEIVGDNPLRQSCAFCGAVEGAPCTRPSRGGRVRTTTHSDRFPQLTA